MTRIFRILKIVSYTVCRLLFSTDEWTQSLMLSVSRLSVMVTFSCMKPICYYQLLLCYLFFFHLIWICWLFFNYTMFDYWSYKVGLVVEALKGEGGGRERLKNWRTQSEREREVYYSIFFNCGFFGFNFFDSSSPHKCCSPFGKEGSWRKCEGARELESCIACRRGEGALLLLLGEKKKAFGRVLEDDGADRGCRRERGCHHRDHPAPCVMLMTLSCG